MTLAAFEFQNNSIKVIDLALKYGYESPESFTRAFLNIHGVTPTTARNMGVQLKAYPRFSFHISIKGDVEMSYKIILDNKSNLLFNYFGILVLSVGNIVMSFHSGSYIEAIVFVIIIIFKYEGK